MTSAAMIGVSACLGCDSRWEPSQLGSRFRCLPYSLDVWCICLSQARTHTVEDLRYKPHWKQGFWLSQTSKSGFSLLGLCQWRWAESFFAPQFGLPRHSISVRNDRVSFAASASCRDGLAVAKLVLASRKNKQFHWPVVKPPTLEHRLVVLSAALRRVRFCQTANFQF